jgi:nucleotide-binding universal stress UspA family protein
MFQMKTLLLPVDFSERSLEAARQAKALAGRFHSDLILLTVEMPDRRISLQFEPGGSSIDDLRSYFERQFMDEKLDYLTESGNPAEVIAEQARTCGADLIVISGHSWRPFESFTLGSVTAEILSAAPCPVWVSLHFQRGPAPLFRRILCGLELSGSRENTLEWALRFADAWKATCDVIHVSPSGDDRQVHPTTEDTLPGVQRDEVDQIRARLGERGEILLGTGELDRAVCDAAKRLRSDLLVIGRSPRGNEIDRVHSACYRLVHDAPCPVACI